MKNEIDEVMSLVCAPKYLEEGESFKEGMSRIADALKDNAEHFQDVQEILLNQRFLPAGRIQASVGAARETTAFNCFVSNTIPDSMDGIMKALWEAALTMRLGGGDGFDFSTLRPKGATIKSLGSTSSGPISFMGMWDAMCNTIKSSGHRRGAMMGVLDIRHPDIEEFITCKQKAGVLTNFNISVRVTDEFMQAVKDDTYFDLRFPIDSDVVYKTVKARSLWNKIMRNTWDHAEPGVLFSDTINRKNNLYYCETISATNPCLHPDTLIETVEGRVRIADIKEPTIVYTSMPDGSLGMARSTASWVSKKNVKVWKITTRNGKEVKVTPDHKLLVHDKGWVKACDLVLGDRIVQLCRARRGAEYSGVKLTTENNRAYRMEHRMIAEAVYGDLGDNVVHHINNDTYDNHIDNFEIMSEKEHNKLTASSTHSQSHQVHGGDGRFIATGKSSKRITPMPEHLKSNMKNHTSNAVVEIVPDYELTDVYDLTVEGTHNMIGNFMVVHNCGEQPLPPNGACLLGSFNLTKYVSLAKWDGLPLFDWTLFEQDIPVIVRAMDNVVDRTIYPLPEQETEAKNKRRMGLGVTGVANAGEFLGLTYGSPEMVAWLEEVMTVLRDRAYLTSSLLAKEKGAFPLFDRDKYLDGEFIKTLPENVRESIAKYGVRNSHLLSIAPTGTISLWAGNISSGIEPVFSLEYDRTVIMPGVDTVRKDFHIMDYAWSEWGLKGRTSEEVTAKEHIDVLCAASRLVDSACSKTCNVGDNVSFEEFSKLYVMAYEGGASGCTTFRPSALRGSVLKKTSRTPVVLENVEEVFSEGQACYIDPITGERLCAD